MAQRLYSSAALEYQSTPDSNINWISTSTAMLLLSILYYFNFSIFLLCPHHKAMTTVYHSLIQYFVLCQQNLELYYLSIDIKSMLARSRYYSTLFLLFLLLDSMLDLAMTLYLLRLDLGFANYSLKHFCWAAWLYSKLADSSQNCKILLYYFDFRWPQWRWDS